MQILGQSPATPPPLSPEAQKEVVCQFLEDIEAKFNTISFFHTKEKKISLKEQYIPIQATLETKRKDVESFLGYAESEEDYKRAYALKSADESQRSQVDWKEAKKQYQNQSIMVLADPGMGKSTLLRMEARTTAQEEKQKLLDNEKTVDDVVFPLFLRLSELIDEKVEEIFSAEIIEAIPILIQRDYRKTFPAISHLLTDKLETGKCLLLLDALDEVPKEHRNRLKDKLKRFVPGYRCPIICTSRIVGYGGAFVEGAKEVEIVPFSQKQTEDYIKIWFKNAENYIEDESVSAEKLIQELRHKPQISGLAQNPLLLSLLCSLYQEKGLQLPARRTQVYEKAVDYMLSKWSQNRKPLSEGKIQSKIWLLEEIAYYFSCDEEKDGIDIFDRGTLFSTIEKYLRGNQVPVDFRNSTPSELIEELSEEDGILQKWDREGDKYLFLHRTFQEYLTASYLNRKIKGNHNEGISLVKKLFWEYDSHETLILLAGLIDEPLLLLQAITKEEDDIFKTLLLLAGRCLAECQDYGKSRLESTNPLIAKIIQRIYKLWRRYPNATFIQSTVVVLGQVNAQMCQTVQAALNHSDSFVRGQAAEALGNIGNAQAVEALRAALNDSDSYVRGQAAVALAKIGNAQAVEALRAALNDSDSDMRGQAAALVTS
jgi:predicted NACHT family NTPase